MKAKLNHFSLLLLSNISRLTINDILGVESLQRFSRGVMLVLTLLVITGNTKAAIRNVPGSYPTIQAAITAASPGDTINVSAGTYTENVVVNKAVTIIGAGADSTIIVATTGNTTPLSFGTTGATVSGFTLTHSYTPSELSVWNFNNNGVSFTSGSGNTLTNCIVTLNRNGIYINTSQNNIISNNTITNNRTGLNATGTFNGTQITGNIISDNWTEGFVTYATTNLTNYSTVVVSGNTFDNNWYTEIQIKDASANSGTLDVTNNTFTDNPVTYSTSSDTSLNEPSFANQIPNVSGIGGTATEPVSPLPTLRIYNSGSVVLRYNNLKTILVVSGQTIQAAINLANAGDKVSVYAGTYPENLTIPKHITLQSVSGAASTILSSSNAGGAAILITHDSVSISGFTITNPPGKHGIYSSDHSVITISNNIITYVGSTDGSASGTNIGIAIVSSSSAVDLIGIVDNNINNIVGGNFRSSEGITIGFTPGTFDITNLLIQNNTISSITSSILAYASGGRGAYGILMNHGSGVTGKTVSAIVKDNTISNLEGSWAHGIGLEGNTPNILVQGNNISGLIDHQTPSNSVAVQVEDNASASSVNIHLNNFSNVTYGVANVVPSTLVNATDNWWGSASGPTIASNPGGTGVAVSDSVIYDPWTGKAFPKAVITWPIGNAIEYTTNPSLNWYLSGSADSLINYTVFVRKSTDTSYSGSFPDYFSLTGITVDTVVIPGGYTLTPGATYFYKVRANFNGGVYTESVEQSFTVDSSLGRAPIAIPSWPIGNATVYTPTPTLNWYLNSWTAGVLSYKVIITDSANLAVTDTLLSSTTSVIVGSALAGGHTYIWRVETINGTQSSGFSDAAIFKLDASQGGAPPAVPSWPIGNTIVYSSTPTLTWYLSSYASGVISYIVSVTDTLNNPVVVDTTTNSFLDLLTPLTPGHTYKWSVETINGTESSGFSTAAVFTVDSSQGGAPLPILSWPIGNATEYTTVPTFSWYLSYGTVGTLNYSVIITDSTDHSIVSGAAIAVSSASFTLDSTLALTPGHTYNWRVKTINGSQTSGYSDAGTFTVYGALNNASIPTPVASWPTGGNTVYSDTMQFSWYLNDAPPSGSYSYTIEIKSQSLDFDGVAPGSNTSDNIYVSGITGNSYTLTSPFLTPGTAYHWRVKLISGVSPSDWSDENVSGGALFSTNSVLSSVTLPVIGAPDHAVLSSVSPSLSWHVTTKPASSQTYFVEISHNKDMSSPIVQYANLDSFNKEAGSLNAGTYYWRVRASTGNGKYSNYSKIATFTIKSVTAVDNKDNGVPKDFAVSQNYPNPFNPSTSINYALPKSSLVTIRIYNILGQEVKTLINSEQQAGIYTAQWNGDNNLGVPAASGIYIYRVTAGQYVKTMKMMLLK